VVLLELYAMKVRPPRTKTRNGFLQFTSNTNTFRTSISCCSTHFRHNRIFYPEYENEYIRTNTRNQEKCICKASIPSKQNKTKQNKTKQNKTKQNKTKQNKTKQNKTKQNKQTNKIVVKSVKQLIFFDI
jgi:hypothetical protein